MCDAFLKLFMLLSNFLAELDRPLMSKLPTDSGQIWRWASLHEGGQPKRKSYDDKMHEENCRVKTWVTGRGVSSGEEQELLDGRPKNFVWSACCSLPAQ